MSSPSAVNLPGILAASAKAVLITSSRCPFSARPASTWGMGHLHVRRSCNSNTWARRTRTAVGLQLHAIGLSRDFMDQERLARTENTQPAQAMLLARARATASAREGASRT